MEQDAGWRVGRGGNRAVPRWAARGVALLALLAAPELRAQADAFEPDNTVGAASNILADASPQAHSIHEPGDVDFVMFAGEQDHAYSVMMTNIVLVDELNNNGVLLLYDPNGTTVLAAWTNDAYTSDYAELQTLVATGGTFFARASADGAGATGMYEFVVTDFGTGDVFEVDNTLPAASSLAVGDSQAHSFHWIGDVDFVSFTAAAGTLYEIAATNVWPDMIVSLYDTNGTHLLDERNNFMVGGDVVMGWHCITAGVYHLRTENASSSAWWGPGPYDLTVQDRTAGGDAYEIDNSTSYASNIAVGATQVDRTIHWAQDRDYIRFNVQAGHYYSVLLSGAGPDLDAILSLYDGTGTNQLVSVDFSSGGGDEALTNLALASGPMFVRVENYSQTSGDTGVYTLAVTDLGALAADPFEPDNTPGTASAIAAGETQTNRTIHVTHDQDWVSFAVSVAPRYIEIRTFDVLDGLDAYLCLFDGAGTNLLASDEFGSPDSELYLKIQEAGTYRIRVTSKGTNTLGRYSLSLRDTRIRHRWTLNGPAWSSPALGHDGRIYVGTQNSRMYALNPDGTTNQVWQAAGFLNPSPSIATNGDILVGNSTSNLLFSFNPVGTTNWVADGSARFYSTPAIAPNGRVLVGNYGYRVLALDAAGTTNWTCPTTGGRSEYPGALGTNGVFYQGLDNNKFYALVPGETSATTNWINTLDTPVEGAVALDSNGMVYVTSAGGYLYAFQAADGATSRVWRLPGTPWDSSPVIGPDGSIYVGTYENLGAGVFAGYLTSLQPGGATNWVARGDSYFRAAPAIGCDGTIYMLSGGTNFYAFNPDGTTNFIVHSLGGSSSAVLDTNGVVYVGVGGNALVAIYGTSYGVGGLAENCWPMFGHDPQHTSAMHPGAPPALLASAGAYHDRVALSWAAVPQAESYEVWRSTNAAAANAVRVDEVAGTNAADTSAAAGRLYTYWVRARAYSGAGGFSAPAQGWRAMSGPPASVAASKGLHPDKVAVTWSAVAGAEAYAVWRNTNDQVGGAAFLGASATTNYDDVSAAAGTVYSYWVQATNDLETTALAGPDSGWLGLAAPAGLAASDGTYTDRVEVAWSAVAGATAYQVWRGLSDSTGSASLVTSLAGTNWSDTGTAAGVTNYYRVCATNALATGPFSASDAGWRRASETPPEPPAPPAPPAGLTASDGTYRDRVALAWGAVSNATGYEIWRAATPSTNAAVRLQACACTIFGDTTAVRGRTYTYWVKATNAAGASGFSAGDSGWMRGLPSGYGTNGASDLVVFDTATGLWYIRALSGEVVAWAEAWGWPGAQPVPGDFDGDGRGDLAVFDTDTGLWYVRSLAGDLILWAEPWGWSGAQPVPGDYDNDAVSDLAVYAAAAGQWFIRAVAPEIIAWAAPWGGPGLDPVPGDYNGDAASDLAVYGEAAGLWYVGTAAGSVVAWAQAWGGPGLDPVPGDYNGDGVSDLAVYSAAAGAWYLATLDGVILGWAVAWGGPGLDPVAGDFDGDGLADLALFDSASGVWYIRTLDGVVLAWAEAWGWPGAVPVSGAAW